MTWGQVFAEGILDLEERFPHTRTAGILMSWEELDALDSEKYAAVLKLYESLLLLDRAWAHR